MTDLNEIPPKAQVGYVLNNATVKQGDLEPDMVVAVLRGKGVDFDSEAEMLEAAHDVMEHRGLIADA